MFTRDLRRLSEAAPTKIAIPQKQPEVILLVPVVPVVLLAESSQYASSSYQNEYGDTVTLSSLAKQRMDRVFRDFSESSNQTVIATDKQVNVATLIAKTESQNGYSSALAQSGNLRITFSVEGPQGKAALDIKLLSSTFLADGKIGIQIGDNAAIDVLSSEAEWKYSTDYNQLRSFVGNDKTPPVISKNASPLIIGPRPSMFGEFGGVGNAFDRVSIAQTVNDQHDTHMTIALDAEGHVLDPEFSDTSKAAYHVNVLMEWTGDAALASGEAAIATATAVNAYAAAVATSQSFGGNGVGGDITVVSTRTDAGVNSQISIETSDASAFFSNATQFKSGEQFYIVHQLDFSRELVKSLIA
jgi:hypothetical protein